MLPVRSGERDRSGRSQADFCRGGRWGPVELVASDGLAAVVSEVSLEDFGEEEIEANLKTRTGRRPRSALITRFLPSCFRWG